MMRRVAFLLPLLAAFPQGTRAQAAQDAAANDGHRLFVQSCAVCHLKPAPNAVIYGPALSKDTVDGREDDVRDLIKTGSERMPGFQYDLKPTQIDAIIRYLALVAPPDAARPAATAPR